MNTKIRIAGLVLLAVSTVAPALAQDGKSIYTSKCASCHGASGMADTGAGKAMKVAPATDPSVKSMSEADMIAATTNGKGKMPAYKGKLSDDEIKASVDYFRTFAK